MKGTKPMATKWSEIRRKKAEFRMNIGVIAAAAVLAAINFIQNGNIFLF